MAISVRASCIWKKGFTEANKDSKEMNKVGAQAIEYAYLSGLLSAFAAFCSVISMQLITVGR
jgi:hypothetical protein